MKQEKQTRRPRGARKGSNGARRNNAPKNRSRGPQHDDILFGVDWDDDRNVLAALEAIGRYLDRMLQTAFPELPGADYQDATFYALDDLFRNWMTKERNRRIWEASPAKFVAFAKYHCLLRAQQRLGRRIDADLAQWLVSYDAEALPDVAFCDRAPSVEESVVGPDSPLFEEAEDLLAAKCNNVARQAFWLGRYGRTSWPEVARVLGCSPDAARMQGTRAADVLARALGPQYRRTVEPPGKKIP